VIYFFFALIRVEVLELALRYRSLYAVISEKVFVAEFKEEIVRLRDVAGDSVHRISEREIIREGRSVEF
jgi:predicted RNA-binding protein